MSQPLEKDILITSVVSFIVALMISFELWVGKSYVHTISYLSDFYWTIFLIFWKLWNAYVQFLK